VSAGTTLLAGMSLNAARRAEELRDMAAGEVVDLLVPDSDVRMLPEIASSAPAHSRLHLAGSRRICDHGRPALEGGSHAW
jgi:hypothetical protein